MRHRPSTSTVTPGRTPVMAAALLLAGFLLLVVTPAMAHDEPCSYNRVRLQNGTCVKCGTWQYPNAATYECLNYPNHNSKLAGDRGRRLDTGDTAWMLSASALVFMMTPGLGFFYAGLAGENTAINAMMMALISIAISTVSWVLFGYSFAYSSTGVDSWGDGKWGALQLVGQQPSAAYAFTIPHALFAVYQCMFSQITPAIISGAVVGRMTFLSYCIYIFVWSGIVYNGLNHWMWSKTIDPITGDIVPLGWLAKLGAIDFAGGMVIHTSSGFAALAAALVLGERRNKDTSPHNIPLVMQGASILYFGWFGFNAGSALQADGLASVAFLNTHISAASAILVWMTLESLHKKTQTPLGAAFSMIVGLIVITPGCGYVSPMAAIVFGVVGTLCTYGFIELKGRFLNVDDTLDAFACHGVNGVVGMLLTGLFANDSINGVNGAFYGRPIQLGYQLVAVVVSASFAFFSTIVILLVLKHTIGIRVSEDVEMRGIDSVHEDEQQFSRWRRNTVKQFSQNLPRGGGERTGSVTGSVQGGGLNNSSRRHLLTPAAEQKLKLSFESPSTAVLDIHQQVPGQLSLGGNADTVEELAG